MNARDVAPEAAGVILAAALARVGVPAPVAAVVVAVAPKLLAELLELVERHLAGAPLPRVERVELPDDTAIVAALVARDLKEGAT